MDDRRRLKRGLKDISPLFGQSKASESESVPETPGGAETQTVAILNPEFLGDTPALTSWFATEVKGLGSDVTILSLNPQEPDAAREIRSDSLRQRAVRHLNLSLDQFEGVCRSLPQAFEKSENGILMFDIDWENILHFEKAVPILDKLILVLNPTLESLSEGYKWIKTSISLNQHLDHYLILSGGEEKASMLFERLSAITARRLGIILNSLGSLDSRGKFHKAELMMTQLLVKPIANSFEKRAFANYLGPKNREGSR
jgi:hypothetical protein